MRVPPPRPLKLESRALLRDVAARLAERAPAYASATPDPTDPGWLLLGEAAWMVEMLSEQLDRYPFAAIQQLVHLMGGQVRPATPALAVVVASVDASGVLSRDPDRWDACRFFSVRTEQSDAVEFVPLEPDVPLMRATLRRLALLGQGRLEELGGPWGVESVPGLGAWAAEPARSALFDGERALFTVISTEPTAIHEELRAAVAAFSAERCPWLDLNVLPIEGNRVQIQVRIDPTGAFLRLHPPGPWQGGDLEGDWDPVPGEGWTPPVVVSADLRLPAGIRGRAPLLAGGRSRIVVPGVPEGFPIDAVLERQASPIPTGILEGIWREIARRSSRLEKLERSIQRRFTGSMGDDRRWVLAAMRSGLWDQLSRGEPSTAVSAGLDRPAETPGRVRLAVVMPAADECAPPPLARAWRVSAEPRLVPTGGAERPVWRLMLPPGPTDHGLRQVLAWDIAVEAGDSDVLLTVQGQAQGAFLNALLAVNAPAVRDGRRWTLQRNAPEPVSLLFGDLLTPEVVAHALDRPLPPETAALLRTLPLAHFSVEGARGSEEPIRGFQGVSSDPGEGRVILNAPDMDGTQRTLRAGDMVRLDWYRRTDGAAGRVPAGAVALVEQGPGSAPRLSRVYNPLAATMGEACERPEAATTRLFGPPESAMALPSDVERAVRHTLGADRERWLVRCWTWTERALLHHELWPWGEGAEDPGRVSLHRALEGAGPDTVLIALGPPSGVVSEEEMVEVTARVRERIRAARGRLPTLRDALVTRLWPLRIRAESGAGADAISLPCFDTAGLRGLLVDELGRQAPVRGSSLLLNACITAAGSAR